MAVETFAMNAYAVIVDWTFVILLILLIAKIIDMISRGKLFSKDNGDTGGNGNNKENIGPPKRKGRKPNKVLVFRGRHRGDRVELSWAANPSDENVNYYWIERRRHARTPKGFGWNRNLFGNWKRVAYVDRHYTPDHPFVDNESYRRQEGIVREWWNSLDAIVPENDYEYRIRAVNSYGKGAWTTIRVSRPLHAHSWRPVIDGVGDDGGSVTGHVEETRT